MSACIQPAMRPAHSVARRKNTVLSAHYHRIGFQRLKAGETRPPARVFHEPTASGRAMGRPSAYRSMTAGRTDPSHFEWPGQSASRRHAP